MVQVIGVGIWAVIVFAAANFFVPGLLGGENEKENSAKKPEIVSLTVQSNVPTIKDGNVRGFIISNLVVQLDKSIVSVDAGEVEQYVKYETFKSIYGAPADAFVKPQKQDLVKFSNMLLPSIDDRLGKGAVKNLLIQEMYFVPLSFLRGRRFGEFQAGHSKK
ncbi:MAG: hypothetical protein ACRBCJ_08615 [Hyphomicrobiaceae bacterium]